MHFTEPLFTTGSAWIPLVDAVAKATMLFGLAGAVSFCLRRASAATRHMVWTLALLSALALPVLSMAVPRWQVPMLTVSPATTTSLQLAPAAVESARSIVTPANSGRYAEPTHVQLRAASTDRAGAPASSSQHDPTIFETIAGISWPIMVLALWAAGAMAILCRLTAGHLAVLWMSRRTERINDAPWLPQARALATQLGISPRIMFLRSRTAAMPMAWGVFLPTVLMPADAYAWPAERLRIVLLHELAHVKRRDCLTHLVAQIACALYWFNPLAWMAARNVRMERERACDDLVLAAGTRGSDYADQLLEVARVMRAGRFPALLAGASLAMAHRSQLEGRLMAILDPSLPRSAAGRLHTVVAATVFACALMPLASVQPWAYAAGDATATIGAQDDGQAPVTAARDGGAGASRDHRDAAEVSREPGATNRVHAAEDVAVHDASGGVSPRPTAETGYSTARLAPPAALADVEQAAVGHSDQSMTIHTGVSVSTSLGEHMSRDMGTHDAGDAQEAKSRAADPRTVAALTAALKDTDKDVRETAMEALVHLRDPSVFAPLVQALTDASPEIREQAAFGLGQMRDRRAVEPLVAALKDQNADVRQQAVFALGQLRDRSAVPGLTSVLHDPDDDVRAQAVFALGQIRDPAAYEGLAAAVRDAKADVRHQAVFSLGQLRDPRGVEPLVSALKDAVPDVREQAAFALGQIRDARAVEALVIALKDSAAGVRAQAAFALGHLRDPRGIDGLTAALKDANAEVRQQAAFALGQLIR
jgi:HEAT repeat protein/beta-lactamase regulating signal transducer with metallopeptidase domain